MKDFSPCLLIEEPKKDDGHLLPCNSGSCEERLFSDSSFKIRYRFPSYRKSTSPATHYFFKRERRLFKRRSHENSSRLFRSASHEPFCQGQVRLELLFRKWAVLPLCHDDFLRRNMPPFQALTRISSRLVPSFLEPPAQGLPQGNHFPADGNPVFVSFIVSWTIGNMKVKILVPFLLSGTTGQSFVEGPHHVRGIQPEFHDEGSECIPDFCLRHAVEDQFAGQKQAHLDARIMAGSPQECRRGRAFPFCYFFPSMAASCGRIFLYHCFPYPKEDIPFPVSRSMSGCRICRPRNKDENLT